MKAVKFLGNKKVAVVEVEKPQPPEGCTLVKVMAAGICRTDIELLYNLPGPVDITPGHEVAGIVEEVNGVSCFKKGDRVLVNCHITCGKCRHCKNGDLIFCSSLKAIGFDVNGGDAEYVAVPENSLRELPDDISFELGVIIGDALGTPYHAVKKSNIKKGDNIGIIGAGPLGLMGVISARYFGAKVFAIDIIPQRLEQAKKFGADIVINSAEADVKKLVYEMTNGEGLDTVVECSGSSKAVNMAFDLLKKRGKLIFVGVNTNLNINPFEQIIMKEIQIEGSRNYNNNELDELIGLIRNNRSIEEVITHRFDLSNAREAFEMAEDRSGIKIILTPCC